MKEIMVTRNNGQLVVSSREVAKNFGKLHKNVIKAIEDIYSAENLAQNELVLRRNRRKE